MSQKYKFRSLQIVENSKKNKVKKESPQTLTVFQVGETKTLDFELLDGTRQNFAYSHYLTSWIGKDGSERVIKIFFATHLVTIKGYCLDEVYKYLSKLSLKSIKANDRRYLSATDESKAFVTSIEIKWRGENDKSEID